MKKVLIIATSFPPAGQRNCERVIKFTRYLPEFGRKPYILTVAEKNIKVLDRSLKAELPQDLEIFRVPYTDPSARLSAMGSHIYTRYCIEKQLHAASLGMAKTILFLKMLLLRRIPGVIIATIKRYLRIPDDKSAWIFPAAAKGVKICRAEGINCIISSAPSFSAHLAAYLIKKRTGCTWIADYRDLWTGNPNFRIVKNARRKIEVLLDGLVARNADAVVTVSDPWKDFMARTFLRGKGDKVHVLPNGYDTKDFKDIIPKDEKDAKFVISHTGILMPSYPIGTLLEALAGLDEPMRKNIRLNLYGYAYDGFEPEVKRLCREFNLSETVNFGEAISRREALQMQKDSDLLLLIYSGYGENVKGMIPSKIFDYIASDTPILGILPDCAASEILKQGRCGTVVDIDDKGAISAAISRAYNNHSITHSDSGRDWEYLRQFERKNLTGKLAGIMDDLYDTKTQKKVLIIATDFPPRISPGAMRTLKFAKYMPEFGWRPVILTPKDDYMPWGKDYRLLKEIPAQTVVYRAPHINLIGLLGSLVRKKEKVSYVGSWETKSVQKKKKSFLKILVAKVLEVYNHLVQNFIFIPDPYITWVPIALIKGLKIIRSEKIDAIYCSAPAFSTFILCYALKGLTGRPWIADYRDLWTGDHSRMWMGGFRRSVEKKMEGFFASHSDAIITVSEPKMHTLMEKIPLDKSRFHLIYNGYDMEDYPQLPSAYKNNGKLTITFTGRLYKKMTAVPFLRALGELLSEKNQFKGEIKVRFVGEISEEEMKRINDVVGRYGLQGNIDFRSYVYYREALEYQVSSDILLLIVGVADNCDGIIPTKLFEYMGAKKPILGIVPPGETRDLIVRSRTGIVADPQDAGAIKKAIYTLVESHRDGRLDIDPDWRVLRKFERKNLTKPLADIFDKYCPRSCNVKV